MKFMKKTFEYLFVLEKGKRFFLLLLLALPAGIALALFQPNWQLVDWIVGYEVGNTDFWLQWNLGADGYTFFVAFAVAILFSIISIAILSTVISRSLRVGSFKINGLLSEFNESFFPALFTVITYAIGFLVLKLFMTAMLLLWQTISNYALSMVLSIITMIVIFVFVMLSIATLVLFLPYMTINGVKAKSAYLSSIRKCGANLFQLFLAIAIPFIVVQAIGIFVALFEIPVLSHIVDSLLFSALLAYFITLSMITYYEIEQIKREDYPKEFFYKSNKK